MESPQDYISRHRKRCESKRVFFSMKEAREFGKRMKKRIGRRQRPYECSFCGCYHLTDMRLSDAIEMGERLHSGLQRWGEV